MTLTAEQIAVIEAIIERIENGGGVINGTADSQTVDELGRIFTQECEFVCGCPGSFKLGLQNTPISTLLRAILCVAAA